MILQTSLANSSFLALLGSMILYWIETSFTGFNLTTKASVVSSKPFLTENKSLAKYGMMISNLLLCLLLLERWKESGHFPLSNLYESLMFLSWCFTSLHLYIDVSTSGNRGKFLSSKKESHEFARRFLGAMTTPSALLTNAFATFTLPKEMQEVAPLVPALQSNWLMMHVTVMILSYAALILGSLLSIAFLVMTIDFSKSLKKNSIESFFNDEEQFQLPSTNNQELLKEGKYHNGRGRGPFSSTPNLGGRREGAPGGNLNKNQRDDHEVSYQHTIAFVLDHLSYRILGIGFPLLTIGILSGAVWANEAWGSYWSWDPKETWAFLTWLIFAIYLHTRLSKGWEGKKPALIASLGFVIVWVCYLGVNLIGEGLHSYGWMTQS